MSRTVAGWGLRVGLGTVLSLLGGASHAQPSPSAEPAAAAPDPAPPEPSEPAAQGRPLLERVLPCGVRVRIARDDSLPVAAVVLALEAGSEDDPKTLPGLHHALAYQLLMGNRDTAPGGIAALVQDAGGLAFLATGPAQIRFESLAPVTILDDLIRAEAGRLRAPTVTESLWKEALVSARRDPALRRSTPWQATAVAHGVPGLEHRPRMVSGPLRELDVATIERELAQRARYERATMVVVAPLPIEDTFAKVEAAFADLPVQPRKVSPRTVSPSSTSLELRKAPGNAFVWALPGEPATRLWADAWCEAIERQRRGKDEPKPNRIRCAFDDDPRRPTLTLRVRTPGDPKALLDARFARLATGGERLLRGPRRRLTRTLQQELSTPLGLARWLAAAAEPTEETAASVEQRTGLSALEASPPSLDSLLPRQRAVRILPSADTEEAKP